MYSGRSHWLPNLAGLQSFATPVVVELLGHGRSPSPDPIECYHPDWYVEEFERIREWVGAEQWFVCGQSLGAALTLRLGLRHPERVRAQAFTNSATAFAEQSWGDSIRRSMTERLEQPMDRRSIDESPLNPANNARLDPVVRAALQADVALHSPVGIARTGLGTLANGTVREEMRRNCVPTLMIVGKFERSFQETRRWVEAEVPNLVSVELDGGHAVNLDAPLAFNEALRSFFEPFTSRGN